MHSRNDVTPNKNRIARIRDLPHPSNLEFMKSVCGKIKNFPFFLQSRTLCSIIPQYTSLTYFQLQKRGLFLEKCHLEICCELFLKKSSQFELILVRTGPYDNATVVARWPHQFLRDAVRAQSSCCRLTRWPHSIPLVSYTCILVCVTYCDLGKFSLYFHIFV